MASSMFTTRQSSKCGSLLWHLLKLLAKNPVLKTHRKRHRQTGLLQYALWKHPHLTIQKPKSARPSQKSFYLRNFAARVVKLATTSAKKPNAVTPKRPIVHTLLLVNKWMWFLGRLDMHLQTCLVEGEIGEIWLHLSLLYQIRAHTHEKPYIKKIMTMTITQESKSVYFVSLFLMDSRAKVNV